MIKSPINWYGGKYYMAKDIIELFPKHKIYVEGFGGSGSVLFRKDKSDIEIYNDINEGLYLLFKILRNEDTREELIRKIQLTPYSREEYLNCKDSWITEKDEIEKVRKFYTSIMQSINSIGKSGWSYSKSNSRRGMSQAVSRWLGNVDENLIDIIERLREIQIENLDIIELINKYDTKDTLFYLDPPYISDTRKSKNVYDNEMDNEKHIEMIETLINVKGKVILSGYENPIYNKLLNNGWKFQELGQYSKRSQKTNTGNKSLSKGNECVWINY